MSTKKKCGIWAAVIVFTPILLIALLTLLLYLPPVQNWAVKRVAAYASESTGMDITVKHVELVFPLRLGVEGVKALQPIDSLKNSNDVTLRNKKDTVADIEKMVVDIQLMPLFKQQVMVDELDFRRMKVNTTNWIHEARIKGDVGQMALRAHGIDLSKELVHVDDALLSDARLSVELSDTVPPDTTPKTNKWKVNIQKLKLKNTALALHMPGDTLRVNAYMGDATAHGTYLDLFKGLYQVRALDWRKGRVTYDNYQTEMLAGKNISVLRPAEGLDFNHIALLDMTLKADSFYFCDSKIDVKIRQAQFRERCGLNVQQMYGRFVMDSLKLQLPDLCLRTPSSTLQTMVDMDMNAFADSAPGKLTAMIRGSIGREDLMLFAGAYMPQRCVGTGLIILWRLPVQ